MTKKSTKSPPSKKSKKTRKAPSKIPTLPAEVTLDASLNEEAGAFPESRFFANASALLGYIEGRPGLHKLMTVFPARGGEKKKRRWSKATRAEYRDRIDEAASFLLEEDDEVNPTQWKRDVMTALEYADDGGALVEAEVRRDSGGFSAGGPDTGKTGLDETGKVDLRCATRNRKGDRCRRDEGHAGRHRYAP